MKNFISIGLLSFLAISCAKEDKLIMERNGMTKADTFWSALVCDYEGGTDNGTKCANGRRDMCYDEYPCSVEMGMTEMLLQYYTPAELEAMNTNGDPIENPDAIIWLKANTSLPLK